MHTRFIELGELLVQLCPLFARDPKLVLRLHLTERGNCPIVALKLRSSASLRR